MKRKLALLLLFALLPAAMCSARGTSENCGGEAAVPIIMYHHMSPKPQLLGTYTISPDSFETDLKWLCSHGYHAVFVSELVSFVRGESKLPEKSVVISFDDAQESFFEYALPLLEKYGMCASLAVIGECADQFTNEPDHNLDYSYMDWEEIKRASESGAVELVSHTYALHSLKPRCGCAKLPGEDENAYREMLHGDLSRLNTGFESAGLSAPEVFAYPYGSLCGEAEEVLHSLGFTAALTCDGHINRLRRGDTDILYRLGRFNRPGKAETWKFFSQTVGLK